MIETVLQAAKQNDTRIWYHRCDVSKEDDVHRAFQTAVSLTRFPLRGLVTCAGIINKRPAVGISTDGLQE